MNQTFVNLRFEQIEKRFTEIDILLDLAMKNTKDIAVYQALCRSAHVLLVSHFEGLYKDFCKDIIDDINSATKFHEVKRVIFNSFCSYFIQNTESEKSVHSIRERLWQTFKDNPSKLKVDPFLFVDNKNPTPAIIEAILEKFGIKNFFWNIDGSDLDVVFEDQKLKSLKLRNRLLFYAKGGTRCYPYLVDKSFYHPSYKSDQKITKTLWEDFINNFLKERHSIIHGHVLDNPTNHESLAQAKVSLEILLYAYVINLCAAANPLFLMGEGAR